MAQQTPRFERDGVFFIRARAIPQRKGADRSKKSHCIFSCDDRSFLLFKLVFAHGALDCGRGSGGLGWAGYIMDLCFSWDIFLG